jgi:hypothetical protein
MPDLLGVDSIAAALRALTDDEIPDVRASFVAITADPDAADWWRELAAAALLAIDGMAGGVDPATALRGLETDLMAAGAAALAGDGALAGSRSRARRRRRGPP